ncbi:hypothetical protein ILYODFUR_034419 [Ilyodon furcidens]|uniref:Fibronectin type-III domain-containing protein n=1 Tax=Ilyodon furcidens TaxID=33524 RepID=A0ABV0SUM0_9TELE
MAASEDEEEFFDAPCNFLTPHYHAEGDSFDPSQFDYVPPPAEVTILHVGSDAVSFDLTSHVSPVKYKIQMDYTSDTHKGSIKTEDCGTVEVEQLIPGTEYTFSITRIGENGNQSTAVYLFACTDPAPPVKITVSKLSSESLSFHWDIPSGAVQTYIVRCCSEGETGKTLATHKNSVTFDSLRPGVCYSLHVSTQLQNGRISKPAISSVKTSKF